MDGKYESDLSRREKLNQQWNTVRNLKGRKRLEYLWNYYKFILVIIVAVILFVYVICVMVQGSKGNTVLSVVIVDAVQTDEKAAETLENQILEVLGTEGEYDRVEIVLSATSGQTDDEIAKLRVALSVVAEADIVICNEDVYEEYKAQGAFADTEKLSGNQGGADSFLNEYVEYSPAYLCVLSHSERTEAAAKLIEDVRK